MPQELWLYLISAAGVSLSGVMLPGPLTASIVAHGYSDKNAGFFVGLGHGIVELPIIALIYFGFASYLTIPIVKIITGLAGGLLLTIMGVMVFFTFNKPMNESIASTPNSSLMTGIVMTGGNPYFLLWWATVGVTLITGAVGFGFYALVLFTIIHLACDIVWDQVVSMTVFKTRHLWTPIVQRTVFGMCAVVLIGFGIWFGVSVIQI